MQKKIKIVEHSQPEGDGMNASESESGEAAASRRRTEQLDRVGDREGGICSSVVPTAWVLFVPLASKAHAQAHSVDVRN